MTASSILGRRGVLCAVAASLVAVAGLPAGAQAARVTNLGSANEIAAQPGEANAIEVVADADRMLVTERGAALLEAGDGCRPAGAQAVACPRVDVIATLGDGDDEMVADLPAGLSATLHGDDGADTITTSGSGFGGPGGDVVRATGRGAQLDGGAGDDRLEGGPGDDSLFGGGDERESESRLATDGGGADTFTGGEGQDSVFYAGSAPVAISLDGIANDGHAGEGDLVGAGIESLAGGAGNDVITGSPARDQLRGGFGDDRLDSGDGDDALFGDAGADRLAGGAGADEIDASEDTASCSDAGGPKPCPGARPAPDEVSCGGARDRIARFDPDDRIDDTCEETFGRPWSLRNEPFGEPRTRPAQPPGTAPPPAVAPKLPASAAVSVRARRAQLSVGCPAPAGARCAGTLALTARDRGTRLGRRKVALRPGRNTVRIALTRDARRLLAGRRGARATATFRRAGGRPVVRRDLRLRIRR